MNKYEVFLWARPPCVLISSAFFFFLLRSIVPIFIASQICISVEASSSFFSAAQAQEFILVWEYGGGKAACVRVCARK